MFAKQHSRSPRTSRLRLEPLESRLLLSGGGFLESQALGTVESPDINEASGMVASRQNADVIWVHNDSGDTARLFAMNTAGKHLGVYNIVGATNIDWEDIAIGPCLDSNDDCLYIADIGDNAGERGSITVYQVPEPVVGTVPISTPINLTAEAITLQYPGRGRDAESLMIDPLSGDLYIISKRETPSHLYFAAASSLFGGETVMLQDLGPLESTFASAADISPDGSEMLVRYYNAQTDTESVLLYDRPSDTSVAAALFAGGVQVPYELEPNGEAVSFNADASGYFTTSEQLHQPINFYERVGESVSIERSTDVPVNIRSNKTITSTITVDQSQTIADLEVQLAIDHSRISDLEIELIGPGGETVALATGRGGSNADYPNTIFDDDALVSIADSTAPPFIGHFQPEGKLSDFGGTEAQGTWTLRIRDTRKGVNGKLTFWSLVITPENLTAPALSISDASIVEGDVGETTSAMFTVTLANPPETNVTVDFSTADGTATAVEDYVATNGTLTFTGGQTTQTITVDVLGDTIYEGNETFLVTLSNADGAQINGASATGTIVENDPAPTSVTIDSVTVTEGETAVFTVTLQNPPSGGSVVVNYSTSDGTATADLDYYGITGGTLTFNLDAEPAVLSQTISVLTIVDSIKREGNETFLVEVSGVDIDLAVGIGTIKDAKGGGGGNGGGGGGGPKKNAASTISTDLADAAFDSFAQQDDAPEATSSPLFDRRGSSGGGEESDDEALAL